MPVRKIHTKAVRLNGYTDGMVVPTGAFRESGVDLFANDHSEKTGATNKVSSYESDAPKIGRHHLPMEGNGLNNLIGAFTLEAFVIPDHGGVVIHKENGFTLKVGEPFQPAPIIFEIHTRTSNGNQSERLSTPFNVPTVQESWGTYTDGQAKPHDLSLPSRELLYVNAQFTTKKMSIFVNGNLVAEQDFGGDERLIRVGSSDLFIGGEGGEYRGVIESVRISRGIVEPLVRPFTTTPDTVGLWDFEDEDDIPQLFFFNNKNPSHPHQGKDGIGATDALMPMPMVCVGYDFTNIDPGGAVTTASGHPLNLASGYKYGYFRIRDFPDSVIANLEDRTTALEMLAAHILSMPVNELKFQSWWDSGLLDISSTITNATYHSDGIPVSNINAIVNASGTNPITGGSMSPFTYYRESDTAPYSPEGGINLDPMANPIERVRIVAIDFKGDSSLGRPPCVVIQSSILSDTTNDPTTQGFLFEHADNTPVWFTLGNGDLVIDPGKKGTRPRGQMTRARFTQNQRFTDRTGLGNDAYFISRKSRMTNDMKNKLSVVSGSQFSYEPPHGNDLLLWLDANDKNQLLRDDGTAVVSDDEYVFWWKNKARGGPTTNAGTDYHFYSWGNGWRWKENCGAANNRSGLVAVAISEVVQNPTGGYVWPGGTPTIQTGVIVPQYPTGVTYYKGSSWVNGFGNSGSARINHAASITATALGSAHASTLYGGGPSMTDGDHSFYFVITPAYGSDPLGLLHSEANDGFVFRLDDSSDDISVSITGSSTLSAGASTRPTTGTPTLIALRIDESTNTIKILKRSNGGASKDEYSNIGFTSTNPLVFDGTTAQTGGIELFGEMTASGGNNLIDNMAQNGFIAHEVLAYPKLLTDAEHDDVVQWFEDRYGV